MEIKPIKTAADHAAALQEIDGLMAAELGKQGPGSASSWPDVSLTAMMTLFDLSGCPPQDEDDEIS